MRWLVGSLFILLVCEFLYAQMSRYGPSSTEWLQSGHDYKKTRRAPLKCTSPANVNRVWTSEDSPGNWFASGGAVYNNTYDWDNNGYVEVSGGGEDCDQWGCDILWRLHWGGGGIIFERSWGEEGYATYWATGYTSSGQSRVAFHTSSSDRFRLTDGAGNTIYQVGTTGSDMTVADINNDGCAEIYVSHSGNFRALNICANSYNSAIIWSVPQSGVIGSAITQFGGQSYVVISTSSGIVIRNAANGALVNTISFNAGTLPTLVDINGDGIDEIIVGGSNSVRAYKFDGTLVWNYTFSGSPSHIAVGRILPGNQLGIAFLVSGQLYVLRASDGAYIAGPIGSYFGSPSIADLNGDGIEGVIVSDGCGNPKEHSYVNGWTNPVWSASGCADEPPITSDLIISKWYMTGDPPQGKLMIVEGDASCFTNVWHCQSAEIITPVDISETKKIEPYVYYEKGYVKVLNYSGNVEIYDIAGNRIISNRIDNKGEIKLKKQGVFIVKLQDKTYKLIANGR
ncbi:MAG: VCBS repeat-containing protein [candidate division WOR-3 bacterium]